MRKNQLRNLQPGESNKNEDKRRIINEEKGGDAFPGHVYFCSSSDDRVHVPGIDAFKIKPDREFFLIFLINRRMIQRFSQGMDMRGSAAK